MTFLLPKHIRTRLASETRIIEDNHPLFAWSVRPDLPTLYADESRAPDQDAGPRPGSRPHASNLSRCRLAMVPERQYRTPLFDAMVSLAEARKVSFHTPGHKSGKGISTRFRKFVGSKIFTIDLTTLDEVDCLQKPVGVIKEAQELAAEAYGADRSFFLVNGTTGGNHAMILSAVHPGDEVLGGAKRPQIHPGRDHPERGHAAVLPAELRSGSRDRAERERRMPREAAMEAHPEARVLSLTSPNYYGIAADLPAHRRRRPASRAGCCWWTRRTDRTSIFTRPSRPRPWTPGPTSPSRARTRSSAG